jgi:hypothetical protein
MMTLWRLHDAKSKPDGIFRKKAAGHLSGCPSSSRRAENFWSLGSFFELDKKEIGHQSPQS